MDNETNTDEIPKKRLLVNSPPISDVDMNDEMGAPKPIWLINIEREEKKKRRGHFTQ